MNAKDRWSSALSDPDMKHFLETPLMKIDEVLRLNRLRITFRKWKAATDEIYDNNPWNQFRGEYYQMKVR